jgi:hypothetical protein
MSILISTEARLQKKSFLETLWSGKNEPEVLKHASQRPNYEPVVRDKLEDT